MRNSNIAIRKYGLRINCRSGFIYVILSYMNVSVVIPNWNGVYLMEKHLRSVLRAAPEAEIIVADDRSTDGSVEYLKKNFPAVIVVARHTHQGFASNVNAGVARARGDIVILLNTDVEPAPDFLAPLLVHFADPDMFAVGCLEKSEEAGKTILRGRGIARWEKGYYIHSKGEIDCISTAWVSGGSGAFRRSMWKELGGMDTLYNPFYWEDIDLSYRARKAGWKTLFEPKSIIRHYHEEGKIKKEFTPTDVKRIAYRNQYIFIWKNVTDVDILLAHIFWTPIRLLQVMFSSDVLMLEGYGMAIMKIPAIVKHRIFQRRLYNTSDRNLDLSEQ
jgi:GT2 family glycosyltransferase